MLISCLFLQYLFIFFFLGKKNNNFCDYDPLQPARDSCRRRKSDESLVHQEPPSPASKSEGALELPSKTRTSDAYRRLSGVSTRSNVRKMSSRMNINQQTSAHK